LKYTNPKYLQGGLPGAPGSPRNTAAGGYPTRIPRAERGPPRGHSTYTPIAQRPGYQPPAPTGPPPGSSPNTPWPIDEWGNNVYPKPGDPDYVAPPQPLPLQPPPGSWRPGRVSRIHPEWGQQPPPPEPSPWQGQPPPDFAQPNPGLPRPMPVPPPDFGINPPGPPSMYPPRQPAPWQPPPPGIYPPGEPRPPGYFPPGFQPQPRPQPPGIMPVDPRRYPQPGRGYPPRWGGRPGWGVRPPFGGGRNYPALPGRGFPVGGGYLEQPGGQTDPLQALLAKLQGG